MIIPRPKDANHKYHLLRLLKATLSNNYLANNLQFKGGTYAALRGVLNRFSLDLDFDLIDKNQIPQIKKEYYQIFQKLRFEIKDQSQKHIQFFLKYPTTSRNQRNTLKLEIYDQPNPQNTYEKTLLKEVGLYCHAHTLDTMFANKLVAATNRFVQKKQIAGRDFYDLHQFFLQGLTVNKKVVQHYTQTSYTKYLQKLIVFIQNKLTKELLNQDLNPLLPTTELKYVIENLKPELISFIRDEINRQNDTCHVSYM